MPGATFPVFIQNFLQSPGPSLFRASLSKLPSTQSFPVLMNLFRGVLFADGGLSRHVTHFCSRMGCGGTFRFSEPPGPVSPPPEGAPAGTTGTRGCRGVRGGRENSFHPTLPGSLSRREPSSEIKKDTQRRGERISPGSRSLGWKAWGPGGGDLPGDGDASSPLPGVKKEAHLSSCLPTAQT